MNILRHIVLIGLIAALIDIQAQDVLLSGPMRAPLFVDPALAGTFHDRQIVLVHRQQRAAGTDPFITQGVSADFCLDRPKPGEDPRKGRAGIGIAFLNDRSASPAFRTTEFQASLAYRLSIDGYSSIAAGLQMGLRQHSLAAADGRWASQYNGQFYDASLSTGESFDRGTRTRPDVGAGVAYSFRLRQDRRGSGEIAFKTGIAVFHAAKPDLSLIEGNGGQVERRYSGFFEGTVGLGRSKLQLRPSAFVNMQGGTMRSLGGLMVEKVFGGRGEFLAPEHSPTLGLGAFVRDGRSVVAAIELGWAHYSVGMSYDMNVIAVEHGSPMNAFEIGLCYRVTGEE